MEKFLHNLKEYTPKKINKINAKKLNSKWLQKLNLLMQQKRLSFALGRLASSIMGFYRFWAGKIKKKNIWKLQKWPLNSRCPPKFDLLLKSTNRLLQQKNYFFASYK
jgi:hypothetical protein